MKDTKTIETLLEVADFINHTKRYQANTIGEIFKYNQMGLFIGSNSLDKRLKVYERAILMAEKKYNRILKQLVQDEC